MEMLIGFVFGIGLTISIIILFVWKIIYPRVQQTIRDAYAIGYQNGQVSQLDFSVNRIDI